MSELAKKHCEACEKKGTPLALPAALEFHKEVSEWHLAEDASKIERTFHFGDFEEAMEFVNAVAELAETEGHHPDFFISWNKVRLTLSTHSIRGLSENDFILAAKIDEILPPPEL